MRAEYQFAKARQRLFYNSILVNRKGHVFSFSTIIERGSDKKIVSIWWVDHEK